MNRWSHNEPTGAGADALRRLLTELEQTLGAVDDPRAAFASFSRLLEKLLDIRKGFLALREGDQTRFLAVAGWKKNCLERRLSLLLPRTASFFEKVAEDGRLYSECITQFFDGNTIERRLLFDDETASFMLRPLKLDGKLIGLLGYSSDVPEAFTIAETGALDPAFDRLASVIDRLPRTIVPA